MNEHKDFEGIDDVAFQYGSFILHNQDVVLCEFAEIDDNYLALKYPVRVRQLPDTQSGLSRMNPFSDDIMVAVRRDNMMAFGNISDRAYEFYRNAVKRVYAVEPEAVAPTQQDDSESTVPEILRSTRVLH